VTAPARRRDRAPISTRGPGTTAGTPRRRRPIAFAIHQLFEYFFAVALIVLSVHIGRSALLLAAGVGLGILAVTARGPLGLIRVCGARLHAVLDVVAGVLMALSPLVPTLRPGALGIVAIELVAVAWLRVTMLTRYRSPAGATTGATVAAVVGTTAEPDAGAETTPGTAAVPTGPTMSAFRRLGRLTAGARTRLPETQAALEAGARRMGGQAGRAQRAWRRAAR
jgi:hypothetical protein